MTFYTLNHMKAKPSKRGGKREGAGRKSEGKKRYDVTLTETTVTTAKGHTDNLSGLLDSLLGDWVKGR